MTSISERDILHQLLSMALDPKDKTEFQACENLGLKQSSLYIFLSISLFLSFK